MAKSILELLVGDLEEKRVYRAFMKRVNALPEDYRFAYKKMQNYLYSYGSSNSDIGTFVDNSTNMFTDLLELFEQNAAAGVPVQEVVGEDLAGFCDELAAAWAHAGSTTREKLNAEIQVYFKGKER